MARIKIEDGKGMPKSIAWLLAALSLNRGEINLHRGRIRSRAESF
jgi:hypothetical protein